MTSAIMTTKCSPTGVVAHLSKATFDRGRGYGQRARDTEAANHIVMEKSSLYLKCKTRYLYPPTCFNIESTYLIYLKLKCFRSTPCP
jgi:hypothetical protein